MPVKRADSLLGALVVAILPILTAAQASASTCPEGTSVFAEHRLFFGRSAGEREVVDDAAWQAFLAEEVTPRFPDGLTVMDGAGQWRASDGTLVRERSKMVLILAEPGAAAAEGIDAIVDAYKTAFDQESVLRVVDTTCAAF